MGNMIPLLQQMSNFSERCNQVVLNLVQQLCSLYSTRWHLYQRVYKNVQLVPVARPRTQLASETLEPSAGRDDVKAEDGDDSSSSSGEDGSSSEDDSSSEGEVEESVT